MFSSLFFAFLSSLSLSRFLLFCGFMNVTCVGIVVIFVVYVRFLYFVYVAIVIFVDLAVRMLLAGKRIRFYLRRLIGFSKETHVGLLLLLFLPELDCFSPWFFSPASPRASRGDLGFLGLPFAPSSSLSGPFSEHSHARPNKGQNRFLPCIPVQQEKSRFQVKNIKMGKIKFFRNVWLTRISTRKSLRCSLNAGMSWSRLNNPCTVIFIWPSDKCGKAAFSNLATNSWTYSVFSGRGPRGTRIRFDSTSENMWARIVACIVKPA